VEEEDPITKIGRRKEIVLAPRLYKSFWYEQKENMPKCPKGCAPKDDKTRKNHKTGRGPRKTSLTSEVWKNPQETNGRPSK